MASAEERGGGAFADPDAAIKKRSQLPGVTKAAILVLVLNKETRPALLRLLSEQEVEMISREVARLPIVPSDEVLCVLEEFAKLTLACNDVLAGGVESARAILTDAFGREVGTSMVERILKSLGTDTANLASLQKTDPRQLSKLIYNEHPQVIALVLSHLLPEQAAGLLTALPAELRVEVARRMAQLEQFSPEMVDKMAAYLGRRLKSLGEFSRKSYGGVRAVAEMMNRLDRDTSESLLAAMGHEDTSLPETIRQLMFVFEDLLRIDVQDITILIDKLDRRVLTVALKGTSQHLRNHFFQCMSARAAASFTEEIEVLGPVKVKDIEAARNNILSTVRKLQAEGVIGATNGGDGYVN